MKTDGTSPCRERCEMPIAEAGTLDQEPVDPSLFDQALVCVLGCLVLTGVLGEDEDEVALPGTVEGATDDRGVDGVAQRRNKEAERAGGSKPKATRDRVRPVVELQAATRIRSRVAGRIAASPRPLMTRDAVDTWTPAARATSASRVVCERDCIRGDDSAHGLFELTFA